MFRKVLIWFLTILVATILNALLGYATGIKAGYLVFYIAVYFVAKKLCQMWDERKQNKDVEGLNQLNETMIQSGDSAVPVPYDVDSSIPKEMDTTSEVPKIRYCRKCGYELIGNSDFCSNCGTQIAKE